MTASAATADSLPARPTAVTRMTEPSIAVQGERAPTLEQILQAGKRSSFRRTVKLTERIALEIHDLRSRLADEREAAEEKRQRDQQAEQARREIAELEARLAEAKAKLRGGPPPERKTAPTAVEGSHHCTRPGCDRAFPSAQGRALHERRAHDGFSPSAAKAG